MPELPEVECIRLCLQASCLDASVQLHQLWRSDIVGSLKSPRGRRHGRAELAAPFALLNNSVIASLSRKGKQLAINTTDGRALIFRLGMSGQLLLTNSLDPAITHVHACWSLRSNITQQFLMFRDPRRFGSIIPCASSTERDLHWDRLGPDALTITTRQLAAACVNRKTKLKVLLLNQSCVCGLGNIYVDEALFLARLHPNTSVQKLNRLQISILASAIRKILRLAITLGGTTLRDYCLPDGTGGSFQMKHKVYGRAGQLCTVCKSILCGVTIAGRSTCYCQKCQSPSVRKALATV